MPDEQARRQAQMQREAQLAMQTERNAARGKFEAQLMTALSSVQLSSPCRVIIPPAAAIQLHCQHDSDANSVRAVLDQFVNAPPAQTEATWVAIDLTPRESGGPEAISRHSNSELPLQ